MEKNGIAAIAAALLLFLSGGACSFFSETGKSSPNVYSARGSGFTLSWDRPAQPPSFEAAQGASCYGVYARLVGSGKWISLGKTGSFSDTSFRVSADALPAGRYEFAVSSLSETGVSSRLHKSTDHDADPVSGWILDWVPTPTSRE